MQNQNKIFIGVFVITFNSITLKPNKKAWIHTKNLLRAFRINRFIGTGYEENLPLQKAIPNPNIIIHELKANDNSLIKFYEPCSLSLFSDEFIHWSIPLIPPNYKLSMEIENIHDKELYINIAIICETV